MHPSAMPGAPTISIDLHAFTADPYPTLARLRAHAPVALVPELGGVVLSRHADIMACEKNVAVFSSAQPGGLMNRLMGHNMMRKDGPAHAAERKTVLPGLSPRTVREHFLARFRAHADRLLAALAARGEADLFRDFALPFSGECLKDLTGLTNITAWEMDAWSQAMIDGIANYAGAPEPEARCRAATAAIDAAIEARLPALRRHPDPSMLSLMLAAGLPEESVRANIRLAISGGQNEPRDAIAGTVWALLTHPDQLAAVRRSGDWLNAFEEYARWISPIGMMPRRIAQAHSLHGVTLEPESRAFLLISSANRDAAVFEDPDRYDAARDTSKSIAFGAGPHFCVGAWASRAMIAEVALPALFARLPRLALAGPVRFTGWAFRGPVNLPVRWEARA